MGLVDLCDSITIISAPHRRDRRRQMRSTLRRVGWDPDGPKMTWFTAIDPREAAGFPCAGSRGCFLSHIAVLNIARNAGHERVLVLEDDCEFVGENPRRYEAVRMTREGGVGSSNTASGSCARRRISSEICCTRRRSHEPPAAVHGLHRLIEDRIAAPERDAT